MRFRFQGLKGLFTYHDFSPTSILSKEIIFEQLVKKFDLLGYDIYKYVLVCEKNPNPHIRIPYFEEKLEKQSSKQHFHIYFELHSKGDNDGREINTCDASLFDLSIEEKIVHGNYISLKTFFSESKKKKSFTFDFDNPSIESKELLKKFFKKTYIRGSFGIIVYLLKEDVEPFTNLPIPLIEFLRNLRKSFLSPDELQKEEKNYLVPLKISNFSSIKVLELEEAIKKEKKEVFTSIVSSSSNCIEEGKPFSGIEKVEETVSVSLDCVDRPELFLENHLKEVFLLEIFQKTKKLDRYFFVGDLLKDDSSNDSGNDFGNYIIKDSTS